METEQIAKILFYVLIAFILYKLLSGFWSQDDEEGGVESEAVLPREEIRDEETVEDGQQLRPWKDDFFLPDDCLNPQAQKVIITNSPEGFEERLLQDANPLYLGKDNSEDFNLLQEDDTKLDERSIQGQQILLDDYVAPGLRTGAKGGSCKLPPGMNIVPPRHQPSCVRKILDTQ